MSDTSSLLRLTRREGSAWQVPPASGRQWTWTEPHINPWSYEWSALPSPMLIAGPVLLPRLSTRPLDPSGQCVR